METPIKPEVVCKDCGHFRADFLDRVFNTQHLRYAKCAKSIKTLVSSYDRVTGELIDTKSAMEYCSTFRTEYDHVLDRCGENGKYWVPKNRDGLFLYLSRVGLK